MFDNIGWIVEAKIADGKEGDFRKIVDEIVEATRKEGGTLNYQYYVADDGDVLVYERFANEESAHTHIENWNNFAERWLEAAPATRMVYIGNIPQSIKDKHAALGPKELKPYGGFVR